MADYSNYNQAQIDRYVQMANDLQRLLDTGQFQYNHDAYRQQLQQLSGLGFTPGMQTPTAPIPAPINSTQATNIAGNMFDGSASGGDRAAYDLYQSVNPPTISSGGTTVGSTNPTTLPTVTNGGTTTLAPTYTQNQWNQDYQNQFQGVQGDLSTGGSTYNPTAQAPTGSTGKGGAAPQTGTSNPYSQGPGGSKGGVQGPMGSANQSLSTPYTQPAPNGSNPYQTSAQSMQNATNATNRVMNMANNPYHVTAGQVGGADMSGYMNPYTQNVIDRNMADINRQSEIAHNRLGAQATAAGAFGGSREAVARGELERGVADTVANMSANLNQANFGQAQNAMFQDIGNNLNAQFANQSSNLQRGQLGLSAANQLGQLGMQSYGIGNDINNNLMNVGNMQQSVQQQLIDAAKEKYGLYTGQPQQALSTVSQALGLAPNLTNQTTKSKPGLFDWISLGLA